MPLSGLPVYTRAPTPMCTYIHTDKYTECTPINKKSGVVCTPLMPAFGRQGKDLCEPEAGLHSEFQASQGYTVRPCLKNKTKRVLVELGMVVYTCNPSNWEAEAGGFQ